VTGWLQVAVVRGLAALNGNRLYGASDPVGVGVHPSNLMLHAGGDSQDLVLAWRDGSRLSSAVKANGVGNV
jgi:hypothetical protein